MPTTTDTTTIDITATDITATSEPDLDAVGTPADPVRGYLDAIGRTPLLTAADEVDLAKRIEAGVYAAELLPRGAADAAALDGHLRAELATVAADGSAAKLHMMNAN